MIVYLILGATYAFAAAVQPGPFQAYLVSRALSQGWRRTLPAALSPLISDGPIALVVLLALTRLSARVELTLRLGGGLFLLYLAARAFRTWRDYREAPGEGGQSTRQSVISAAVVNLLNPNPYIGWGLVMGPLLLKGWRETPANGLALVVGFYGTMILALAGIIMLFASARSLGPRVARGLVGVSAVALAAFGGYQLWAGAVGLLRG